MHDIEGLGQLLLSKVLYREETGEECVIEQLLAEAGYVGAETIMRTHSYVPHIRLRNKEAEELRETHGKTHHWVVERAFT